MPAPIKLGGPAFFLEKSIPSAGNGLLQPSTPPHPKRAAKQQQATYRPGFGFGDGDDLVAAETEIETRGR